MEIYHLQVQPLANTATKYRIYVLLFMQLKEMRLET